ncbi:MAG: YidC/Oxa1 family insertase periplasmic-domain containing protein, partial [Myxococcota bacterium]
MDSLSEQQRVLLAVVLSVGILLGWQYFFAPPPVDAPTEVNDAQPAATENAPDELPPPIEPTPEPAAEEAATDVPDSLEAPGEMNDAPAPPAPETRPFQTDVLTGVMSNIDGHLEQLELKEYTEHDGANEEGAVAVDLVAREGANADRQAYLEFDFGGVSVPPLAFAGEGLALAGANQALDLSVQVVPDGYALRYAMSATNKGSSPIAGVARIVMSLKQTGEGRSMFSPAADVVSGLCFYEGGVDRDLVSSLVDTPVDASTDVQWAGIDRQYFVLAAVPVNVTDGKTRCSMRAEETSAIVTLELPVDALGPGETWSRDWVVFAGPKRNDALEAV